MKCTIRWDTLWNYSCHNMPILNCDAICGIKDHLADGHCLFMHQQWVLAIISECHIIDKCNSDRIVGGLDDRREFLLLFVFQNLESPLDILSFMYNLKASSSTKEKAAHWAEPWFDEKATWRAIDEGVKILFAVGNGIWPCGYFINPQVMLASCDLMKQVHGWELMK